MGSTTEVQCCFGTSWHSCQQHGERLPACPGQSKRQPFFGYKNGIIGTWPTDDPHMLQVSIANLLVKIRLPGPKVVHTNVDF